MSACNDKKSVINSEKDIGYWWKEKLEKSMKEAREEDKRMAEERGSFHDGFPVISVIAGVNVSTSIPIMPTLS